VNTSQKTKAPAGATAGASKVFSNVQADLNFDAAKAQVSRSTRSTEAQIEETLALLMFAPRHTHELRAHGVSHPAGRVADLRERGYTIDTSRVTTVDTDGFSHIRVARYSLVSVPGAIQ
jgi:hypothetical protein